MKFSVLQPNIKKAFQAVNSIVGKQINLPILNNVVIKTKKQGIKILATNLEIGIVYGVRGKVEQEGEVVVDAKTLLNFISVLPISQKINFEQKDKKIIIKTENYLTKINYQNTDEFPIIPEIKNGNEFEISAKELQQALNQILFAVSLDTTKPELTGVLMEITGGYINFVGTDGFRLAEKKIEYLKTNNKELKIIIPNRVAQEVCRIISLVSENNEEEEKVFIQITENQIQFLINSVRIVSRLIEGRFPDYKQIIPTHYKTSCTTNKTELTQAIKATSLFTKEKLDDISLKFLDKKNLLMVSASSQTGESVVNLKAEIEGQDNNLFLNYRYLLDGLNNIETNKIRIDLIDNNTPCVVRSPEDKTFTYLIMPLKQ